MDSIWLKASFAAAVVVVAGGVFLLQNEINPPEKGSDFLQSQGYTDISGGGVDLLSQCGKGVFGRNYEATKDGRIEKDATVCFSPFGQYRPFFEFI